MTLPVPNLDDRRFQDLVDEAKRMVGKRCKKWTDHNVSDPGVTLIETFAYIVDQLIYRVNRVPDRMYLKFLELIGVTRFPPTAANTDVTFWLSAPQPVDIRIPVGTEVSTTRTETEDAVSFQVTRDLVIPPVSLNSVASAPNGNAVQDHTDEFAMGLGFDAFDVDPKNGDAMFLGLSAAAPSCVLLLRFDCEIRGLGIDPSNPPIDWQAWSGSEWGPCEVLRDSTGGLNRPGDVLLHLPPAQTLSTIGGHTAAWLRCLVSESPGQEGYSASPRIRRLVVASMGGTTRVANAEEVTNELIGSSAGVPGQRFTLRRAPVVPSQDPLVIEMSAPHLGNGTGSEQGERWTEVSSFASSGPDDRHFTLDRSSGEVTFGPAVRESDGKLRRYGAVPPPGALLRITSYRTGGGRRGNVGVGAINVLKSSIPYIARVENLRLGTGGVDGEDIEEVKIRGPLLLRSRDRAVTPEDYEYLVREVAPEVARVRCIPARRGSAGAVRVMIVPKVPTGEPAALSIEQLTASAELLRRIDSFLETRRIIGVRVAIDRPDYRPITVVARIKPSWRASGEGVRAAALSALYRYLHPVVGGPDGDGWIFGRPVHVSEIQAVLDDVPETDVISEVLLFAADLKSGQRVLPAVSRFPIENDQLPLSFEHQVHLVGE